jgi:hypothetical protein
VDDIAVFGKDLSIFKKEIKSEFNMKELGKANLLLGIKIIHDPNAIVLSQLHYKADIDSPSAQLPSRQGHCGGG